MLKKAILMMSVLAVILSACGGDDGGDAASAADCVAGEVDGDLNFYNWSEYMDPELITAFEEEYGVSVTESFYESNEAMLAQIDSGVSYDLIVPSDYMVNIMITAPTRQAIPAIRNGVIQPTGVVPPVAASLNTPASRGPRIPATP